MRIGFSIGSIHKFIRPEDGIDWLRVNQREIGYFNILEIVIPPEKESGFQLSKENYKWLCGMKYLSYHLTQCTEDTEKSINQFPFIDFYICHINQKNILTEPFIKKYGRKILFENVEDHEYSFFKTDQICFDIAHALSYKKNLNTFYNTYEKQIRQIHLSNYDPELKHITFHNNRCLGYDFDTSIRKYPIILEASFNSLEEMKNELLYIKRRVYV